MRRNLPSCVRELGGRPCWPRLTGCGRNLQPWHHRVGLAWILHGLQGLPPEGVGPAIPEEPLSQRGIEHARRIARLRRSRERADRGARHRSLLTAARQREVARASLSVAPDVDFDGPGSCHVKVHAGNGEQIAVCSNPGSRLHAVRESMLEPMPHPGRDREVRIGECLVVAMTARASAVWIISECYIIAEDWEVSPSPHNDQFPGDYARYSALVAHIRRRSTSGASGLFPSPGDGLAGRVRAHDRVVIDEMVGS